MRPVTQDISLPIRLQLDQACLLLVDLQTKLVPLIPGAAKLIWNVQRLIQGAGILQLPVLVTEQYPAGLGPTLPEITAALPAGLTIPAKLSFSCCGSPELMTQLQTTGSRQVIVAGIEAHVCLLQTVLDLLSQQYQVFVVVDACGARHELDQELALQRMTNNGAILTTVETTLFELCRVAGTPQFKQLSAIVRQAPPTA